MVKQISRLLPALLIVILLSTTTTVAYAAPKAQGAIPVSLPDINSGPNSQVTVPVTVGNTTGQFIIAFEATITYDPAILSVVSVTAGNVPNSSGGWSVVPNTSTPGQIIVSAFSASALSGSGSLLNLVFDVIGGSGSATTLAFSNFTFNEGEPAATTTDGSLTIVSWALGGQVLYQGGEMAMSGVTIDLAGATPDQAITDIEGYVFTIEDDGGYTVTPSFSGQVNGITAYDAAYIAQCVAEVRPATDCPELAADTSGSDGITAFDAALVAQYVVGLSNPASLVGTWVFDPTQNTYASISSDLPNEDFAAYLVGEVTGNWSPLD